MKSYLAFIYFCKNDFTFVHFSFMAYSAPEMYGHTWRDLFAVSLQEKMYNC